MKSIQLASINDLSGWQWPMKYIDTKHSQESENVAMRIVGDKLRDGMYSEVHSSGIVTVDQ